MYINALLIVSMYATLRAEHKSIFKPLQTHNAYIFKTLMYHHH